MLRRFHRCFPPVEVSPPFVFTEPPQEPSGVPASSECPDWTPSCEATHLSHFCALGPFPGCLHRVGTLPNEERVKGILSFPEASVMISDRLAPDRSLPRLTGHL